MIRKIVEIDETRCNGCELCVKACHENAIEMVDGKARLVSDIYCDGLGDCLPACPTGAIRIIERSADAYSQDAVDERLESQKKAMFTVKEAKTVGHEDCGCNGAHEGLMQQMKKGGGCPGSAAMTLKTMTPNPIQRTSSEVSGGSNTGKAPLQEDAIKEMLQSKLSSWPVQINLVNPNADYLEGADLLIAADCTAFAYGNFHNDFIKGRVTLIGCPKLDDNAYYTEKIGMILKENTIRSITVVRMEVPCCSGIVGAVKQAMLNTGIIPKYNEITIGLDGNIK